MTSAAELKPRARGLHAEPLAPPEPPQRRRLVALGAWLLVFGLGAWIISPRFTVAAPSLIDDWANIDNAPGALAALLRLDYVPAEVADPGRFRPGYTAVWNFLQWHTLGAPASLWGPNAWNHFRLGLWSAALVAVPVAVARVPADAGRLRAPALALLAALPPALVLASLGMGREFARFGPVEPVLVGGTLGGGALIALALGRWLRLSRAGRRPWRAVAPAALAGYALWLLGVYHKEASVCLLVLAPFLFLFLNERWQAARVLRGSLARRPAFWVAAALLGLPVLHVALEVARVARTGSTLYGARVPGVTGGIDTLVAAFDRSWGTMTQLTGSPLWSVIGAMVPFVALVAVAQRRPCRWLALGLAVTGWAVLVFQALGGAVAERYYIAVAALWGVAAVLLLAEGDRRLRLAALATGAVLVLTGAADSRAVVTGWAGGERAGSEMVERVARLDPARCPVYLGGLEIEVADAVPELVALKSQPRAGSCRPGVAGLLVTRRKLGRVTAATDERIHRSCAAPGWIEEFSNLVWQIRACRSFLPGAIDGRPVRAVLAANRLVPGKRFSERPQSLRAADVR